MSHESMHRQTSVRSPGSEVFATRRKSFESDQLKEEEEERDGQNGADHQFLQKYRKSSVVDQIKKIEEKSDDPKQTTRKPVPRPRQAPVKPARPASTPPQWRKSTNHASGTETRPKSDQSNAYDYVVEDSACPQQNNIISQRRQMFEIALASRNGDGDCDSEVSKIDDREEPDGKESDILDCDSRDDVDNEQTVVKVPLYGGISANWSHSDSDTTLLSAHGADSSLQKSPPPSPAKRPPLKPVKPGILTDHDPRSASVRSPRPVPPKKPPRTFKHDVFTIDNKCGQDGMQAASLGVEIESLSNKSRKKPPARPTSKPPPQPVKRNSLTKITEISEREVVDQRIDSPSPSSVSRVTRQEPPPRPPPPQSRGQALKPEVTAYCYTTLPRAKPPIPSRPPTPKNTRKVNDELHPAASRSQFFIEMEGNYDELARGRRCGNLRRKSASCENIYEEIRRHVTPEIDSYGYAVPFKSEKMQQRSLSVKNPTAQKVRHRPRSQSALVRGTRSRNRVDDEIDEDNEVLPPKPRQYTVVKQKLEKAFEDQRSDATDDIDEADESDNAAEESDTEISHKQLTERLSYVRSVKSRCKGALLKQEQLVNASHEHMFESLLCVSIRQNQGAIEPYIRHCFPSDVNESKLVAVPQFCFPDCNTWKTSSSQDSETFSFVLTSGEGGRSFGYCKRFIPVEAGTKVPIVYCAISPVSAYSFYSQLLREILNRHRLSETSAHLFIQYAYSTPLPPPGDGVTIRCPGPQRDVMHIATFARPADSRLEQVDYACLLNILGVTRLLKVFSAILLERRVLFTASRLSTLTSCVHAATALLYPFCWQHTFIPVLPAKLLDFVCSPTPFVIGILTECRKKLASMPLSEVLLVDLDRGLLQWEQGDEGTIIPRKLYKALSTALNMCIDDINQSTKNLLISEAFIRLFLEMISHYRQHICTQQDRTIIFQKESFVTAVSSRSLRMFLQWFTETQMFEVFVNDRTQSLANHVPGVFETRLTEYELEKYASSNTLKVNVRQFGKKSRV